MTTLSNTTTTTTQKLINENTNNIRVDVFQIDCIIVILGRKKCDSYNNKKYL